MQKNDSKISEMRAAGRKERSVMYSLITMNKNIEDQRAQKQNAYSSSQMMLNASINFG